MECISICINLNLPSAVTRAVADGPLETMRTGVKFAAEEWAATFVDSIVLTDTVVDSVGVTAAAVDSAGVTTTEVDSAVVIATVVGCAVVTATVVGSPEVTATVVGSAVVVIFVVAGHRGDLTRVGLTTLTVENNINTC